MDTAMRVPPRYADDPRVKPREGGGYTAVDGDKTYKILYSVRDRWYICLDPSDQPMRIANGCFARFYNTPVQAIAFAIGEPATTKAAA
jgi:hypothetical protein